jgi:eukaryotic-like serine/threonine-protein kinase
MFVLMTGLWVVNTALNAVFYPSFVAGRALGARSLIHLGTAIGWALLLAILRSRPWSVRALSTADLVGTLLMGVSLGAMVVLGDPRLRPEMVMSMSAAHLLVLRAAIVPSTARRTALVGAATEVPIVVCAYVLHLSPGRPTLLPPAASIAAALVVWALVSIATTSVISSVIYGLRQKVREAMRLGQYTLESKLGEGGMGVVYKARHSLLRRPTVIKLLSAAKTDESSLARFEREVQSTAALSHPNIVAVYDFGRSADGIFYYAMEYIEGLDLEKVVRADGAQPEARVKHILLEAADALAEAHVAGLIHRDIKPSNILVRERARGPDQVKIVDFGLVKVAEGPATLTGVEPAVRGTPLYMAPETIQAPKEVDLRADLYALGAVGYYLLCGGPVFEGQTVIEVCARHLHEAVTPPSVRMGRSVSPKLERCILRCLAKSPAARPANAQELVEELRACDDVSPWTTEDARRWWAERAPRIREAAVSASARTPSEEGFAVHLGGRAG